MQLNVATYQGGAAVTPSDSAAQSYRALYVGTTGTLRVIGADGSTVNFGAVVGLVPIEVQAVHAAGTTATNIVGLR